MRHLLLTILVTSGWAAIAGPVAAQYPYANPYPPPNPYPPGRFNPYYRPPALSPYLNLNNRGNPAVNYYNFVAPQLQANQLYSGFQGAPPPPQQGGDEVSLDPLDPTATIPRASGHPSTFNYTGGYFNSLGSIGAAAGRPAGAGAAPQTGRRR